MKSEVSIITINYNNIHDTEECIGSIKQHLTLSYELIVVDNGSDNQEAERLQEKFPWVKVIAVPDNRGFAGGNNIGIREAEGKYILLLNNDTFVTEDKLSCLIETLNRKPEIGGVSPKIRFADALGTIQYAGYSRMRHFTVRNHTIGCGEQDKGQYELSERTNGLHGAAMILKREVIDHVGLIPEFYFLYYEELDWCEQMAAKGYELWYEPRCVVYHKESRTTGVKSALKTFYLTRNRLLYAWRNRTGVTKWIAILYQLLVVLPKNSLLFLKQNRGDLSLATWNGAIAFFPLMNRY